MLAREFPNAFGVAENLALGNANPSFVRLVIIGCGKLHRVRCNHRQIHALGQFYTAGHVGFIIGAAGALQFDEKSIGKQGCKLQSRLLRTCSVTLHQRLPHRPGLRA